MTGRPKVLLLGEIYQAHEAWSQISAIADIVQPQSTNRADFMTECASGAFTGVTVAYHTYESTDITGKIDKPLLDALPQSLRFICHAAAGYDDLDISACTDRSVLVSNTPTAVDDATADITIWLLLGALRNLAGSMAALRAGQWRGHPATRLGHDPQGKVLGILGMGGIGRNVATKVYAFGMTVRYFNRTRLSPELEGRAEYVSLERLLGESDVLSLNLPLNEHTRHAISTEQFDMMKEGIVIVNTARGGVMDEEALVRALEAGKVASVGLDVYEEEPHVHPGLVANPNVLLLPHMGTWTVETTVKLEEWAIDNVRMAIQSGTLKSPVSEQKDLA